MRHSNWVVIEIYATAFEANSMNLLKDFLLGKLIISIEEIFGISSNIFFMESFNQKSFSQPLDTPLLNVCDKRTVYVSWNWSKEMPVKILTNFRGDGAHFELKSLLEHYSPK